jgi:molybdenum cofactor synthesis domain-containing protein
MEESLLPPRQAIVAFFTRVAVPSPEVESVALEESLGRVLARGIAVEDDIPAAPRSAMDGFAVRAQETPGSLRIALDAHKIVTGGVLPPEANAVVPIEEVRVHDGIVEVDAPVEIGVNVVERGADMGRGEIALEPGRRIGAPEIGVLATLGVTNVPVYRRPVVAVLSSGDELVDLHVEPGPGQVRDSNRYAIAASLRAMGAIPRHYPTLRDEAAEFETALRTAFSQCDAVACTGGSSVGERDRLPYAVAAVASPGIVVHGLRVKPGKPTLFGADGGKPILGLPGNPTSALMMLQAVAAPIVAALAGAPLVTATVQAQLDAPARSRAGWTWYVPVTLRDDGGLPFAHPLALRSFSVSLTARADGFIVMEEGEEEWPAGKPVTVHRFLGG